MQGNRYVELFGKNVPIRTIGCSKNGTEPIDMGIRCNLFIQVDIRCNANCSFCEFHGTSTKAFDLKKLGRIVREITDKTCVGKINFTGGEPTIDMVKFDEVIQCVKENMKGRPEITLNTNGIHLLQLTQYERFLDFIGLSRHHYDNARNSYIFQDSRVAGSDEITQFQKSVKNKKMVQLRCNLITGEIDCYDEIVKYMEHAINMGISDCGFVTLMPINPFCNNHQVDFPSLVKLDDNMIEVAEWTRLDEETKTRKLCQCSNYIYSSKNGEFCRFYRRLFCNCNLNAGTLVFDGENLRLGFGGEIIL